MLGRTVLWLWLVAAGSLSTLQAGGIVVQDIYGCRVNERGTTLVDWEG